LIKAARHIPANCRPDGNNISDLEFMDAIGIAFSGG